MPDVDTQAPENAAAQGVLSGNLPLAPAGGTPNLSAVAPTPAQHSAVGKVFHGILDTLSGGQTEPAMDANGQITEAPAHRTGGEWARRILAGALTGMVSGAKAPVRPGGGASGGIGAGFEGEEESLDRTDATKRGQLQENFKNQQAKKQQDQAAETAQSENLLRKAQAAYLTTQNVSLGFELSRKQAAATDDGVKAFNTFQQAVGADPSNTDLGVFADMNAVLTYRRDHPELASQIAGGHDSGQILAVPNLVEDEKGNWSYQGVRAAIVHPSVNDRTVSEVFGDQPIPGIPYFVPGKMAAKGQEPGAWQTAAPAPGTKYGDYLSMLQKSSTDAAKENQQLLLAQVKHEEAGTEAETARANLERSQAQALLGTGQDELGRPLPALPQKDREKRYDTFTKDYVKDKDQLEQSWQQMNSILGRAQRGEMTGADSVVGLFNAVGISSAPLKGRGFRINSSIVGEHVGARNVFQGAAARLSKLTPNGSGELVTPQQLQAYANIMSQARHDLYVSMSQEAERQGLPKDFLPRATAGGQPIDPGTAKIFLDSYAGDPAIARQAAQKFGWAIPQAKQ